MSPGNMGEMMTLPDLYRREYEEPLATPVMEGRKTEKKNSAGRDHTGSFIINAIFNSHIKIS